MKAKKDINLPDLLTVDEAADFLRWTREYVRELLRAGRLPGFKLRTEWRVPRLELEQWVARGCPRPGEAPDLFE